jgi:hypothetical protein
MDGKGMRRQTGWRVCVRVQIRIEDFSGKHCEILPGAEDGGEEEGTG